jgi:hypothetical protein
LAFNFGAEFQQRGDTAERRSAMITLEDCIGLCGLSEAEVEAVSEHEHIPEIAAAALAQWLLNQPDGSNQIRKMIIDDIHRALDAGQVKHAAGLFSALRHFLGEHPEAGSGRNT